MKAILNNQLPNSSNKVFRKDINGLRAVAVLGVLLFHLFSYFKIEHLGPQVDLFSGGYVGVDIFFVISGFLMTSIIVKRLRTDSFSLWDFWKRRASRICPALMVLVILVLFIGAFIQIPHDYRETGRESLRALFFISNFWFARDQGYFTNAVIDQPLLHTWSLSVEWQFYLIYPILLLLWGKIFSLKTLPYFIAILFGISLTLSLFLPNSPASYFMLHMRAWELLLGGIIFVLPPPSRISHCKIKTFEILSLTVIVLNMVLVRPMDGWEPLSVLPAVFACAFMLWLKVEHSLLSARVFQFMGKISYSMYLIHWPVIAFCSILNLLQNIVPIIAFIFIYSCISYYCIEIKRHWHWTMILIYIAVIVIAQLNVKNKGQTPFNASYLTDQSYREQYYGGRGIPDKGHIYTGIKSGQPYLLLAGDSFARQYTNFFNEQIPFTAVLCDAQLNFGTVWCAPLKNITKIELSQRYFKNLQYELNTTTSTKVMIAHNWSLYLKQDNNFAEENTFPLDQKQRRQALVKALHNLADKFSDKQFFIIGQTFKTYAGSAKCTILKHNRNHFMQKLFANLNCPHTYAIDLTEAQKVNRYLQDICQKRSNLHFIDTNIALCKGNQCRIIDNNDMPIFSDEWHLSLTGAKIVGGYILDKIKETSD